MVSRATGAFNAQAGTKPKDFSNLRVKYEDIDFSLFEFENSDENDLKIKGRLRSKKNFWKETLKANNEIMKIISEGYKLPFIHTPRKAVFSNHNSSYVHKYFVDEAISSLIRQG